MHRTAYNKLVQLGKHRPELRPHIRPILAAVKSSGTRTARGTGPISEVLMKHWNDVHDIERALEDAVKEYDVAASYGDGSGSKGAEDLIKQVQKVVKMLEDISMKELNKLLEAEKKWIREHGDVDEYIAAQQDAMYRY